MLTSKRNTKGLAILGVVLATAAHSVAQTYQVGGDGTAQPANKADAKGQTHDLGWGSNIDNARLARTAEIALQRGDRALAFSYAQRAAQAAPNDAQLWFLFGYAARLDGKLGAATDAYQHGLRLNHSSIDGMSGLAQTYIASGRPGEAERLLKAVIAAAPQRRTDLLVLSDLYMRSGNYEAALQYLNSAERLEPVAQSELLMAVAYQHLKKMDQASHYLALAKSRSPNNPDVQRALAAFYRETGAYAEALESLERIKNPKPDVIAELAFTYGIAGRAEDAARTYTQAADLLPLDLNLQLSTAQAYVNIGLFDRADKFLTRASGLSPNYYRLHAIRGEIAQIQDRNDVAAAEVNIAIANLPPVPLEGVLYGIQLHVKLIALYRSLDDSAKADEEVAISQRLISQLDEQGSDRAAFLRLRAVIHADAGEFEAALSDLSKSLELSPGDPNSLQLDGDVLMKLGRTAEAITVFQRVLQIDPHSRFALTSLGYAFRANGDKAQAARYFLALAKAYPSSYVPYLALGDMYTEAHQYTKAEEAYAEGFKRAPKNSLIVAGGMNAAIEARNLRLAGVWQRRVVATMESVPQVLREEERYFSFTGDTKRSADLGRRAIALLPQDREVVTYLGYDLLRLEQLNELKVLTMKYMVAFPKQADIPLLAGYVAKYDDSLEEAAQYFTDALRRDPSVVTAYTNRGFVYNDLGQPALAAADFEESIRRNPNDGEAHMGLAFADLNLGRPKAAIRQTEYAQTLSGDSKLIHTVRATAYGRIGMLTRSAQEYSAALALDPKDGSLYLGLANIYFAQRRFHKSLDELQMAEKYLPADPMVYAMIARNAAAMHDREATLRAIDLADRYAAMPRSVDRSHGPNFAEKVTRSDIDVAAGEALSALGDDQAAMDRFAKALELRPKNRLDVRLAVAKHLAREGQTSGAERQLALAQLEVDAKDASPMTGDQYITAAGVLQELHDYELSKVYLERAKATGAPETAVHVSLANSYLALGETQRAAAELAAVKRADDGEADYQYLLAQANLYQQEHRSAETLSSFAAATSDAGDDPIADQGLIAAGGGEGFRLSPNVSMITNLTIQPIFEDSTVYVLDSRLNSPVGPVAESDAAQLPTPRSSVETNLINSFNFHFGSIPAPSAFVQVRNAQGTISVPATRSVVHRNTTDYAVNLAINPTAHLGTNAVTFDSGVQGTIRRDTRSPIEMDQNLFRVFTYATTSSFFNVISADGYGSAEFGKFTNSRISERLFSGGINFRVGTPWGKNHLLTGWSANSQNFNSAQRGNSENFFTTSYIGFQKHFAAGLTATAIIEDLRSWRSQPFSPIGSAVSQAIRPGLSVAFSPTSRFELQAATSYEDTRGFHAYDMTQSSFTVFYTRPLNRSFSENNETIHVKYPLRLAAGIREETFPNFTVGTTTKVIPFFSLSIF